MHTPPHTLFQKIYRENLGLPPTKGQEELISRLTTFLWEEERDSVFVLTGYAGTGKTTMVSALVKSLPSANRHAILLAPTGRAAKVLGTYSEKEAFTIHKYIYFAHTTPNGNLILNLAQNKHRNALFIIDEASMIPDHSPGPDGSSFSSKNILDDLMAYVFSGFKCKLLLLGDEAQLPPVGLTLSPALNMKNLTSRYPYHFQQFTLTEVVRQQLTSGILAHATTIRQRLTEAQYHLPLFGETHYPDFIRIDGSELQDALEEAYSYHNEEHAVVVTRSNKRANLFNQEIRKRILFREGIINAGDLLMVTRNNYFWMPEEAETRFIANGDLIEILRIKKIEVRWGFQFADVEIRFPHFRKEQHIETKILLDTLTCEGPALPRKEMERLWYAIMEEQMELSSKAERIKKTRNSAWFNALQVKFAYAITCHKTQGGQWDTVFIDQGFMREPPDKEWFRWIYTAITRAMKRVYLVNFREDFWY